MLLHELTVCLHLIMLRNTFLYRVLQRDKLLFTVFILFLLGQAFFTYKQIENTPFFHFGMYSAVHTPQRSYTVYSITVDTARVRSLDFADNQREVVYNTIGLYDGLKQMHFNDTLGKVISHRFSGAMAERLRAALLNNAAMDTPYQKWLFQYIADMRMVKTPVIEVTKQQACYLPNGSLYTQGPPETVFKLRDE
jgi:hypothetical protein